MPAVIGYSNYCVAEKSLSIEEFVAKFEDSFIHQWSKTFIKVEVDREDLVDIIKSTGTQCVRVEERKNEPQLFCKLFEQYFEATKVKPEEIDCIIYAKGDPVIGDINVPYFLQQEFQIPRAQIFCVEQECASTLLALKLGQALINEGSAQKVIILARNIFESYEKRLMGLFLVSDGLGLLELNAGEVGLSPLDFLSTSSGNIAKVYDFTLKAAEVVEIGVKLIQSLLTKNNLTMKDIALIIPQNTNSSGWNIYAKHLDIAKEQIFMENFGGFGHLGDVDMIRNITDIKKKQLLSKNSYAFAYALGTGTSWDAFLFKVL